jgi:hypothetical protein
LSCISDKLKTPPLLLLLLPPSLLLHELEPKERA